MLERWVDGRLAALDPGIDWRPNTGKALARLQERHGHNRRWAWAAAMAAAACLGAVAFPDTRVLAQRCVGACSDAGLRLWQSLSNSGTGPARGMAPDFTLNDASGEPIKLSNYRGKVVLLNFWATWCPPCKVEIPWFVQFQRTYEDRGFVVLGVSLDENGWESVRPYLTQNQITYPVMIGDGNLTARYGGVTSLPATFIIDRSGRIASAHLGLASKSEYVSGIEEVLKK